MKWNEHYKRWVHESVSKETGTMVRILQPRCFGESRPPRASALGRYFAVRTSLTTEDWYGLEDLGREPDGTVVLAWVYKKTESCPPPEPEYGEEVIALLKKLDGEES